MTGIPLTTNQYIDSLKKRLKVADVSYGMLARAMGREVTQVSRWMNKRTGLSMKNLVRIEKAFARLAPKRRR
jgi:plasmid maintenance system antidote protein VapI